MKFRDLDGILLDRLSAAAGRVQVLTGWDCLTQGHFCYRLGWLFYGALDFVSRRWGGLAIDGLVFGANFLDSEDVVIRSNAQKGPRNPRRICPVSTVSRYATSIFVLALTIVIALVGKRDPLFQIACFLYGAANWLNCCDPLPPCNGKIQEWVKGLMDRSPEPVMVGGTS